MWKARIEILIKLKYINNKNENIYINNDFNIFKNVDLIENNNIRIYIFIIK